MTAGASALLIFIGGGAAAVAAIVKTEPRSAVVAERSSTISAAVEPAAPVPPAAPTLEGESRISDEADRTATRGPRRTATGGRAAGSQGGDAGSQQAPAQAAAPIITTSTVTETRPIPYRTRLVRDPSLPRGSRRVETPGIAGEQTLRWLVTRTDGKETGRELIDTTITRQPQHQVIAFGSDGRGGFHRHLRECGPGLHPCLPLGRRACPDETRAEESAVQLGGSVTVLDKDLALVDPNGLELDPGPCPTDGPAQKDGPTP
jgi:hypothetical protein